MTVTGKGIAAVHMLPHVRPAEPPWDGICAAIGADIDAERANSAKLLSNIALLLKQIGDPGKCRGCGADIWWVTHKNGKKAPYTAAGLNHFADCSAANKFKKPGSAA